MSSCHLLLCSFFAVLKRQIHFMISQNTSHNLGPQMKFTGFPKVSSLLFGRWSYRNCKVPGIKSWQTLLVGYISNLDNQMKNVQVSRGWTLFRFAIQNAPTGSLTARPGKPCWERKTFAFPFEIRPIFRGEVLLNFQGVNPHDFTSLVQDVAKNPSSDSSKRFKRT